MTQSTYELIETANDLIDRLWGLEGVVDDETDAAVDQWLEDCPDKLGAIAAAKRRIKDDVASLKAEEDRIKDRRKTLEKSIVRVSQLALGLLQAHQELTGETKIKRPDLTAWIATTKSVEVINEADIPSAFLVTTTRPDKTAIGKTLKGGEDVPGCELVEKTGARFR
jgi:hypothetical protein